ncbi:PH domain-containing protein [Olleya sp. UBA1516]|mgnify:CR=1 FL=1|uniref:PH domain-containing protein n=1 Tax=Olleya sp. UBA1516 TaxID=1947013 RepID=UPI0025F594E9|nr:PH domain-containing protein [Olleya sp. UBA1516]
MNTFYKIISDETVLLKLKKKSDIGFWQYQILGLLSFFANNQFDYLFITNKRIVVLIKDTVVTNIEYHNFKELKFNSMNNTLSFNDSNNQQQQLSLNKLRLTYEEIQLIKKKLHA